MSAALLEQIDGCDDLIQEVPEGRDADIAPLVSSLIMSIHRVKLTPVEAKTVCERIRDSKFPEDDWQRTHQIHCMWTFSFCELTCPTLPFTTTTDPTTTIDFSVFFDCRQAEVC